MTLNIQGSTVGYDMNGMQQLINDVYTNCVIPASQSMRTNAQNTRYAIDQVWVGSSAEAFKEKLSNDTETLCKTLEEVAEAIRNDMNNAGSNVEEYDDEIARALFASSGGGSTGTPQTAGTPNAGGAVNPTTGVIDVVNPPSQTPTNPAPDAQGIEGDGNPGATPAPASETPADPGQTPAPASETPTEGGDQPVEGGDQPTEGGDQPTEGGDQPTEGEDNPTEGEDQPTEGEDKPTEGEDKPTEGEENPETPTDDVPPEVPATPEVPETPETPTTPENPETPATPETPETPSTPETPTTPGTLPQNEDGSYNVTGTLSPGTTENTFPATPYTLSDEDYKVLCATIYAEASENSDYVISDSMAVASALMNRADANGGDLMKATCNHGQIHGYGIVNGSMYNADGSPINAKFARAMNNPDAIPAEMRAAIDLALAGNRNTTGQYWAGNGTYNKFRDEY